MSTRSKSKRATTRKPAAAPKTAGRPPALERVELAQKRLVKNGDLFRQAQDERKMAVRRAFQSGVTVRELSTVLEVSQAKVYDLLGGVRGSKPSPSPRKAG